jgi:hypothetical protein
MKGIQSVMCWPIPETEFLKGATVQLYGCAKFFRDFAKFGFLNAKMPKASLFYLFWVIFFLPLFVCAKLSEKNVGHKKNDF